MVHFAMLFVGWIYHKIRLHCVTSQFTPLAENGHITEKEWSIYESYFDLCYSSSTKRANLSMVNSNERLHELKMAVESTNNVNGVYNQQTGFVRVLKDRYLKSI